MNNFEPKYTKLASHYLDEKLQALRKQKEKNSLLKTIFKKFNFVV